MKLPVKVNANLSGPLFSDADGESVDGVEIVRLVNRVPVLEKVCKDAAVAMREITASEVASGGATFDYFDDEIAACEAVLTDDAGEGSG